MTNGGHPADSAAPVDVHASALAMLAESSAARTATREESTAQTQDKQEDVDAEEMQRVRKRLQNARAKMGASLAEIPTGREYDSPPDASDEPVYDALEKAYNAAFLVHPTVETGDVQTEGHLAREEKAGHGDDMKVADMKDVDKSQNVDKKPQQVGTLKSMCLSTLNQNGGYSEGADVPMGDANEKVTKVAARDHEINPSSRNTPDRSKTPASLSAESVATTASPPQSPMSAYHRTSSEDGFISTPEVKREPRIVDLKPEMVDEARVERADHLSLNEFLISELEVYCSRLLGKGLLDNDLSGISDLARITSLQLFQDHRRALMDFDDEWKRSHADSRQGYTPPKSSEELPAVPTTMTTNPFQQDTASPIHINEWATLLNGVKASCTKAATSKSYSPNMENGGKESLFASYHRGSNGVVISGEDCQKERLQINTFMTQIASVQSTPAFYVVVAAGSDLAQWEKALSSKELVQLYPYWGRREDRQNLLQLLSNEYFSCRKLSAHVLLTSYEVFMEDISTVTSLQCQLSVIDIPGQVDARKLLHFLVPELFSTRRKLLAWSSAALHSKQIHAVCDVVKAFTIASKLDDSAAFISKVNLCTKNNSKREMVAMDALNKQGMVRAIEPSIMVPMKRVSLKKSRSRTTGHIPAKVSSHNTPLDEIDSHLTIKTPNAVLKKRRGSDGMHGSRQRIGRCGKCAGCLTEDCMKCGHCQDMKKYGGPGLRKQSCKNRKCLNPRIWGLASRKRKRSKTKRADLKVDSEMDEDGSVAYSSVESDGESLSTATYENGDSDDESVLDSDAAVDSPRDLLLPASDTLMSDHLTLSDLSSRSGSTRSRVVRCGECEGCHAPDCMKCPHCLDMKKYGGPGHRKQTCKSRKCNAPKVVMLNHAKEGQFVDEMGNVVYSGLNDTNFPGFYEAPDTPDSTAAAVSPKVGFKTDLAPVIRECELFVKPRLGFACKDCAAGFSSKLLLNFHARVEHSQSTVEDTSLISFEHKASKLLTRPIYQSAMVNAHIKQPESSPLGYAKLEGRDFQYFFIEPFVVLGRMEPRWCNLYRDLGFPNLKGLAAGDVDCHVGNDSMITTTHAVIAWDARLKSFVIECLSLRAPISVNGREVSFASPPVVLSSRNLVQIGASVFYFLLPKATKKSIAVEENTIPQA
ncbi:hypothetical protein PF005_g16647 [Phytophthora fragariae]|uniref:Uncharacterized protein n=1 Tax=Phytophthora fragariae TaxID=53985 RepID=A0A6A4D4D1_9STRA|nr:hypothetical protein PF003_g5592 [Phytophthora fragariae]KAE8934286.1 hypothetical protein PF009_g15730 [Phytophthora fragariae]KAE8997341.1 hypothetical protein PF011_g15529 [Phytophthora fragariae]KAE9096690.1 hypothetical protein PF010_g16254 [Phytophthora fragariae]KAE9099142.1 hypothetical protein PF007_g15989 [Phytophthora fragariae]